MPEREPYEYVVIRVVPRVERGECINAGVVLICRPRRFLDAKVLLDRSKVRVLDPTMTENALDAIDDQLQLLCAIARGLPEGGALAQMEAGERWHLLSAPSSTIVQPSPVHTGLCVDPGAELDELFSTMVLPPGEQDGADE